MTMTKIFEAVAQAKVQMIALDKLRLSSENMRKTYPKASIRQLAASIAAQGLLQNLAVEKKGERFEVVAGGRRYRALKLLVEQKVIARDHAVPCQLRAEGEATEVSLTENFQREPMHPADGQIPEEIAARFGISQMTVRRRLKLANVSPQILNLFRKGEASLEQLQALALSDDHAIQEAAFNGVSEWQRHPQALRQQLAAEAVPASHKLARFVTAKAYQAANGHIIRDLFAEEGTGYFADRALLTELAARKLGKAAEAFEETGWAYVEAILDFDDYAHRLSPDVAYSKKDAKRVDALQAKIEALDFEADDQAYEAQETLEAELAEIEARSVRYSADDKARSGVIFTIAHDGSLEIIKGVVRPEVWEAMRREARKSFAASAGPQGAEVAPEASEGKGYSAAVIEDVTKFRTACLAIAVADHPAFAQRVLAFTLASQLVMPRYGSSRLSTLAAKRVNVMPETPDDDNAGVGKAIEKRVAAWQAMLPSDTKALWDFLMEEASAAQIAELVAFCVALTVDAVHGRAVNGASREAEWLVDGAMRFASLDLALSWTPSVAFFKRVPKAVAAAAVKETGLEAGLEGAIMSAKKAESAAIAAKALAGTGWLPSPMLPFVPEFDEHDAARFDGAADGDGEAADAALHEAA
jgi:ParB family transcriptional regulator, chromosome partitioning protein